jgi:hypothetical protein
MALPEGDITDVVAFGLLLVTPAALASRFSVASTSVPGQLRQHVITRWVTR